MVNKSSAIYQFLTCQKYQRNSNPLKNSLADFSEKEFLALFRNQIFLFLPLLSLSVYPCMFQKYLRFQLQIKQRQSQQ